MKVMQGMPKIKYTLAMGLEIYEDYLADVNAS